MTATATQLLERGLNDGVEHAVLSLKGIASLVDSERLEQKECLAIMSILEHGVSTGAADEVLLALAQIFTDDFVSRLDVDGCNIAVSVFNSALLTSTEACVRQSAIERFSCMVRNWAEQGGHSDPRFGNVVQILPDMLSSRDWMLPSAAMELLPIVLGAIPANLKSADSPLGGQLRSVADAYRKALCWPPDPKSVASPLVVQAAATHFGALLSNAALGPSSAFGNKADWWPLFVYFAVTGKDGESAQLKMIKHSFCAGIRCLVDAGGLVVEGGALAECAPSKMVELISLPKHNAEAMEMLTSCHVGGIISLLCTTKRSWRVRKEFALVLPDVGRALLALGDGSSGVELTTTEGAREPVTEMVARVQDQLMCDVQNEVRNAAFSNLGIPLMELVGKDAFFEELFVDETVEVMIQDVGLYEVLAALCAELGEGVKTGVIEVTSAATLFESLLRAPYQADTNQDAAAEDMYGGFAENEDEAVKRMCSPTCQKLSSIKSSVLRSMPSEVQTYFVDRASGWGPDSALSPGIRSKAMDGHLILDVLLTDHFWRVREAAVVFAARLTAANEVASVWETLVMKEKCVRVCRVAVQGFATEPSFKEHVFNFVKDSPSRAGFTSHRLMEKVLASHALISHSEKGSTAVEVIAAQELLAEIITNPPFENALLAALQIVYDLGRALVGEKVWQKVTGKTSHFDGWEDSKALIESIVQKR